MWKIDNVSRVCSRFIFTLFGNAEKRGKFWIKFKIVVNGHMPEMGSMKSKIKISCMRFFENKLLVIPLTELG